MDGSTWSQNTIETQPISTENQPQASTGNHKRFLLQEVFIPFQGWVAVGLLCWFLAILMPFFTPEPPVIDYASLDNDSILADLENYNSQLKSLARLTFFFQLGGIISMFVGLHKLNEGLIKNTEISNQNLNILVEKVNKKS